MFSTDIQKSATRITFSTTSLLLTLFCSEVKRRKWRVFHVTVIASRERCVNMILVPARKVLIKSLYQLKAYNARRSNSTNRARLTNCSSKYFALCNDACASPDWSQAKCIYLSVRSSILPSLRPFVRYQSCERDILKTNKPIFLQIGSGNPWGAMRWHGQLWRSGGQRSRSHDAEVRLGDLVEASFSTPSVK